MITASRSIRFKSGALRRGPQPEVRGLCESEQLTARNRSIHFKSGVKDAYGGVVIGRWCGVWEFQNARLVDKSRVETRWYIGYGKGWWGNTYNSSICEKMLTLEYRAKKKVHKPMRLKKIKLTTRSLINQQLDRLKSRSNARLT